MVRLHGVLTGSACQTERVCSLRRHVLAPSDTSARYIGMRSDVMSRHDCRRAVARRRSTVATSTGRTGRRSRARASMRALRWRLNLRCSMSRPTGHGATHGAQRAGSSSAHCERSR